MKLIELKTNREVKKGDKLLTFRNEEVELIGMREPSHEGSSGRIAIKAKGWEQYRLVFPSVCGLEWVNDNEAQNPPV